MKHKILLTLLLPIVLFAMLFFAAACFVCATFAPSEMIYDIRLGFSIAWLIVSFMYMFGFALSMQNKK